MILKAFGTAIGIVSFLAVLFLLAINALHQNLWVLVVIIAVNLIIGFALPKIFGESAALNELKGGLRSVGMAINDVIVWAALFIAYVIGVGLVWVISRIAGKKFISDKNTSWHERSLTQNSEEMF